MTCPLLRVRPTLHVRSPSCRCACAGARPGRPPVDFRSRLVLNGGVTHVLGVDSSTQSTKALLIDASDGTVVEQRTAPHPSGTEVDPRAWLAAFDDAAGPLLARASAVSVGGQQHGMVALDRSGEPV